jgi:hypothetical protein
VLTNNSKMMEKPEKIFKKPTEEWYKESNISETE